MDNETIIKDIIDSLETVIKNVVSNTTDSNDVYETIKENGTIESILLSKLIGDK